MNYIIEQLNILKQSFLTTFVFSSSDLINLKKESNNLVSSNIKMLQDIGNIINKIILHAKRINNNNIFIYIPKILVNNNRIFISDLYTYKDEIIKDAFDMIFNKLNKNINLQYIDINASLIRFFLENYQDFIKEDIITLNKDIINNGYHNNTDKENNFDIYLEIVKLNKINQSSMDREIIKYNLIKSFTKVLYKKGLNDNDLYYLLLILNKNRLDDFLYNLSNDNNVIKNYWMWIWNKQKEILIKKYDDLNKIKLIYINGDGLIFYK